MTKRIMTMTPVRNKSDDTVQRILHRLQREAEFSRDEALRPSVSMERAQQHVMRARHFLEAMQVVEAALEARPF